MKGTPPEKEPRSPKSFYDFTLFSEVVVLPGTVLTPFEAPRQTRVTPLRRRASHRRLPMWGRTTAFYISPARTSETELGARKQGSEVPGESEEDQWATMARRARLSWMDENPY